MSKLRIFYIFSLVLLGVLLVFTVFQPMATGGQYSELLRESLLQTENGWILQFDILNHEDKDTEYTINTTIDGNSSTLTVSIRDKGAFTYIKHINRDMIADGVFSFTVYKEGDGSPIKQVSYYLK